MMNTDVVQTCGRKHLQLRCAVCRAAVTERRPGRLQHATWWLSQLNVMVLGHVSVIACGTRVTVSEL